MSRFEPAFFNDSNGENHGPLVGLHYNQWMRLKFAAILTLVPLLAACGPAAATSTPDELPPTTPVVTPTAELVIATPVEQQELSLPQAELQARVSFTLLGPSYLPDGLASEDHVRLTSYADGSQTVESTYRDASGARALVFTQSDMPLELQDWFRLLAPAEVSGEGAGGEDTVTVRGYTGRLYRNYADEASLLWQEDGLTYILRLAGRDWPAAESRDLLLWVAESLQPGDGTEFAFRHRAPSTWLSYTSAVYKLSFAVPRDWQQTGDATFQGKNGFARLEPFKGYGVKLDQACEMEANLHPERYGRQPTLRSIQQQWGVIDVPRDPCLILPGAGAPANAEATLLLSDPTRPDAVAFLRLAIDPPHAEQIAVSLDLPHETQATATFPLATPDPASIPAEIAPQVGSLGPLTMESYPIVAASLDAPGHFEFNQRIPAAVLARRADLRAAADADYPTGATSAGRAVTLEQQFEADGHGYAIVRVDGNEVYRYALLVQAGGSPSTGVWNWAGRWVLEVNGLLVVEGEPYNLKAGYQEIFGFRLIDGKPFFFFVQDGTTGIFYDGKTWPALFDSVFHGACCEPAIANPRGNDAMLWFYGLQQGWWDYVELGLFGAPSP